MTPAVAASPAGLQLFMSKHKEGNSSFNFLPVEKCTCLTSHNDLSRLCQRHLILEGWGFVPLFNAILESSTEGVTLLGYSVEVLYVSFYI